MTDDIITLTDELREAVGWVQRYLEYHRATPKVMEALDTIAAAILPPERKVIDVMAEAAMKRFYGEDSGAGEMPEVVVPWQEAIAAAIDAVPVTDALLDEIKRIRNGSIRANESNAQIVAAVLRHLREGVA